MCKNVGQALCNAGRELILVANFFPDTGAFWCVCRWNCTPTFQVPFKVARVRKTLPSSYPIGIYSPGQIASDRKKGFHDNSKLSGQYLSGPSEG